MLILEVVTGTDMGRVAVKIQVLGWMTCPRRR
jgi:hypothetical protein